MNPNAQRAYLANSVSTASPAALLIMLYERLSLDLQRGLAAIQDGDAAAAHGQLTHAQDIVLELRHTLRVDVWEGGPALASLYDYLYERLVRANVEKDAEAVEFCLVTVNQLRDSWREAALSNAAASA
ncbi:flagellar export chaperone FliS [Nocardioides ferulae]|uniref:flagellar export chaperone FliS n=1 Tax=Nocardioides ferulae TaxID=2340821 RepID=UPI000EAFD903|nr:flagellar export chaperone FliS [Nocardioides ferulae]